jgi:hypothetical protein
MALPFAGNRGRLDRNSAFTLLKHKVRRRVSVVDITVLMDLSGVKKNAFRGSGLACINMRDNADISNFR